MLKLTRLSTVGGNDPMRLTLGAPIRKAAPSATPPELTPVPGKPHLFVQGNGAMAYLPPEPSAQRQPAMQPALAAPYGTPVTFEEAKVRAKAGDEVHWIQFPGTKGATWSKVPDYVLDLKSVNSAFIVVPKDASPPSGFVPQPGVWREDTPPKPGWYCASKFRSIDLRRYWHGTHWSLPAAPNDTLAKRERQKACPAVSKPILWRDDIACNWE